MPFFSLTCTVGEKILREKQEKISSHSITQELSLTPLWRAFGLSPFSFI
jgi:hypothetical protein